MTEVAKLADRDTAVSYVHVFSTKRYNFVLNLEIKNLPKKHDMRYGRHNLSIF